MPDRDRPEYRHVTAACIVFATALVFFALAVAAAIVIL